MPSGYFAFMILWVVALVVVNEFDLLPGRWAVYLFIPTLVAYFLVRW